MSLNRDIEVGSYVGNGSTQSVSIGWQPTFVMTFARYGGNPSNRGWGYKSMNMAGSNFLSNNTAAVYVTTNGVTLTSTGFSVGSNVTINGNTDDYSWFALRDSAHDDHGSYTGDGGTQTITLNRQPIAVFITKETGTAASYVKFNSMPTNTAMEFITNSVGATSVTILSTGFQVTNGSNTSGETYGYTAIYNDETIHWETGSFTGTGASQTVTTGRQPSIVIMISLTGIIASQVVTAGFGTGEFGQLTGNWSLVGSNGATLISTGFTTGADSNFNTLGEVTYYLVGYA